MKGEGGEEGRGEEKGENKGAPARTYLHLHLHQLPKKLGAVLTRRVQNDAFLQGGKFQQQLATLRDARHRGAGARKRVRRRALYFTSYINFQ